LVEGHGRRRGGGRGECLIGWHVLDEVRGRMRRSAFVGFCLGGGEGRGVGCYPGARRTGNGWIYLAALSVMCYFMKWVWMSMWMWMQGVVRWFLGLRWEVGAGLLEEVDVKRDFLRVRGL